LWFTAKPADGATGLIYMGARYYDPTLGRFMAIDPLPVNPLGVHGINRYAYANNNPFRFYDPTGAATEEVLVSGRGGHEEPDWNRDEYIRLASIVGTPKNSLEAGIQQAIRRGDIGELRLLLGEAGEQLTANELLIAQRALAAMETLTAEDTAMLSARYGVDFANKIIHVFGKSAHGLGGVVEELGSAAKAFAEAQRAVETAYAATGSMPSTIQLGSFIVRVTGAVVEGTPRIGTMFIP
jgi:RHS repeat-associated protein